MKYAKHKQKGAGTDRADGTLNLYSSLQLTEKMKGLDKESKLILVQIPVLAVILKNCVREYADFQIKEIEGFIEADSITVNETEVSNNRTNDTIKGMPTEFSALNEMLSRFDILFRSLNPILSDEKILVNLHIDIEPQKDYRPGYPIEKRGIYYLARELSSQIPIVTKDTNYDTLEKCYSIFICRDNIPAKERYTITRYCLAIADDSTYTDIPEKDYDLLELVILRLGQEEYDGGSGVLDFLNLLFYPHKEDFTNRLEQYIDLSSYEDLKKETRKMRGLGESILNDGIEKGIEQGLEKGKIQGETQKLISQICRKLRKGKAPEVIADELEEDLDIVERICTAARETAPEYDEEAVYEALQVQMI